jgi:alcohol dehydrogenase class IV
MSFEFATFGQLVFGEGCLQQAGTLARPWGQRALVVTGSRLDSARPLVALLRRAGIESEVFDTSGEPSLDTIRHGLAAARASSVDMIIGLGGGSPVDAAKAIAGLATNPGEITDYLEIVGPNRPLTEAPLPWMAIPTTAGTGAEATRNAVLSVPERGLKVSLRSPRLLARIVLLDPILTYSMPGDVTAASGLDALTQLIEAYVCVRANPLTDALCAQGIPQAATALPRAFADPGDRSARSAMCLASLWSGMALANAGLGAVHGFASPIGGRFSAPHGAICAALLAPVIEGNLRALRDRQPDSPALARYTQIAQWLTGNAAAQPDDAVRRVRSLVAELRIAPLSAFGVTPDSFDDLVALASAASSMKANPIVLTTDELKAVLLRAL